jgi:putative nucleotidyltransferase with HDIG domain
VRSVLYRLWQFLAALWTLARTPDDTPAREQLGGTAYAVFRRMAAYDRAHALRVFHGLRAQGVEDPALLQAGLLHDLGKSAGRQRIPLLYRGPIVLARRVPRLWTWLARERPAGDPRQPFSLYARHAARGAELAREAGCSARVVGLIAAHHDAATTGAASLLQEADRRS